MKKAIIIGAKGQDGQLLTSYLVECNYTVLGVSRSLVESSDNTLWEPIDILNYQSVLSMVEKFLPQEIYYLAAFHHSSENPELANPHTLWVNSSQVNVSGLANVLESIRSVQHPIKLFYASSCLVYGAGQLSPQTEQTPFSPSDIYGITKAAGTHLCQLYRKQYNIFAAVGVLYNHESSLRANHFVSQKIIQAALNIKSGKDNVLYLGDLTAEIDWGYAPDYVRAMHLILQLNKPDDFIISTGKVYSIRDFVNVAFSKLNLDWTSYVKENKNILQRHRGRLCGDSSKLQQMTGWKPSVSFEKMIECMIKGELTFSKMD